MPGSETEEGGTVRRVCTGRAMKNVIGKLTDVMKRFRREEDGVAVLEIILIIVVLIGLVLIFKSQLTSLVNNIFQTITSQSGQV